VNTISNQAEEYLETIYRLETKFGYARTMSLSKELGVVPGSITNTIDNLEKKGLVIHEPYKGVKLSETGKKIASKILRRHRLAERLLTDLLHLDWSQVHEPACQLEHALPQEIIRSLEKVLGHPKRCPHGNPIPTNCGAVLEEKTIALVDLNDKNSGFIVKITEEKSDTLKKLTKLNLKPGQFLVVEKKDKNGSFTVRLENNKIKIGNDLASIIFVRKIEEVKK
jgi:DtxR family Mn-dependent transcriptional regulator